MAEDRRRRRLDEVAGVNTGGRPVLSRSLEGSPLLTDRPGAPEVPSRIPPSPPPGSFLSESFGEPSESIVQEAFSRREAEPGISPAPTFEKFREEFRTGFERARFGAPEVAAADEGISDLESRAEEIMEKLDQPVTPGLATETGRLSVRAQQRERRRLTSELGAIMDITEKRKTREAAGKPALGDIIKGQRLAFDIAEAGRKGTLEERRVATEEAFKGAKVFDIMTNIGSIANLRGTEVRQIEQKMVLERGKFKTSQEHLTALTKESEGRLAKIDREIERADLSKSQEVQATNIRAQIKSKADSINKILSNPDTRLEGKVFGGPTEAAKRLDGLREELDGLSKKLNNLTTGTGPSLEDIRDQVRGVFEEFGR